MKLFMNEYLFIILLRKVLTSDLIRVKLRLPTRRGGSIGECSTIWNAVAWLQYSWI